MPASKRVSPVDSVRAQIDELFSSGRELGQILEEVARLGVKLLLQVVLEAELTEFLGRHRYARGERSREGLRNGYSDITVKSTAGPIRFEKPKVRGASETFVSRLLRIGVTRTAVLESLVIAGFVRGLSVRDVEATLAEALGEQAALSKSTVSEICQVLVTQFKLWSQRDLSDCVLDYLFCDASMFKYHDNAGAEPLLCSWGITIEGKTLGLLVAGVLGLRTSIISLQAGGTGSAHGAEVGRPAGKLRCRQTGEPWPSLYITRRTRPVLFLSGLGC